MLRRQFLSTAAAGLMQTPPAKPPQSRSKMNVVVILADDLGARDLGIFGSTYHETNHLDSAARAAMRFTQAYAACPVCSPTRASILTGKYPARLQLTDWIPGRAQSPAAKLLVPKFEQQLPKAEVTLAEVLKDAGYVTASIGKWHLGGTGFSPLDQGFDENIGGTERGSPPSYFPPYKIPGIEARGEDDYLTDNLTDRAEKFIEQNKSRPFFLYLPHFAPHLPLQAKKKLIAKYEAKAKVLRAPQSDPVYAAMVESLDEGVGRLLRKIDELQLNSQTAFFFLSDNGGLRYEGRRTSPVTDNAPLRAGKGHLYEGGIRIPFFVWWPGVHQARGTSTVPISTVDIMPTILDLLGLPKPQMDGVSLADLMRSYTPPRRDALYWHYPHYSNQGGLPGGAVRRGDHKLIEFYEDGRLELYRLSNDPGEKRNLIQREPETAATLLKDLQNWRTSVNAAMPRPNPAYDESKADQGLTGAEKPTPPV